MQDTVTTFGDRGNIYKPNSFTILTDCHYCDVENGTSHVDILSSERFRKVGEKFYTAEEL